MFTIENYISYEIVQKIGWVLLHFIWQAASLAILLAILLRILRRFSANLRYIAACLALLLIVALPFVTIQFIEVASPPRAIEDMPAASEPEPIIAPPRPMIQIEPAREPQTIIYASSEPVVTKPHIDWEKRIVSFLEPKLPHIVTIWLLGVFALSVWHLGGYAQLQKLRKKMVKPVDASLNNKLQILSQKLGVTQTVQLLESALVQIPTVVGWLKPVILLPASVLTGLSTEQLEAILAHELAHIKRYDYLVNMLQTIVEILGFYHPAVWWVSHKIRTERENCCDDIAVAISGNKINYAKALTLMEEIRGKQNFAVAAAGGNLFSRIRRLLVKDSSEKNSISWIPAVIIITLLITLAISTTLAIATKPNLQTSEPNIIGKTIDEKPDVSVESASGVPKLLTVLEDKKFVNIRGAVIPLVEEIGDREPTTFLAEQLQADSRERRCNAALLLELLGDRRGVPAIIKELNNTSYRPTIRIRSDGTEDQRGQVIQDHYYAALMLGILGDKKAVSALIEATEDETIDYQAAISLGQIGDKSAIPALQDMLKRRSENANSRLFAAYGLAMLDDEEGFKTVVDILNNKQIDWVFRLHAIEALGKLGNKEAIPDLIASLKDEHPNIRASAAKALGEIGDVSALPALKQALEDKTKTEFNSPTTVSEAAAEAISQIQSRYEDTTASQNETEKWPPYLYYGLDLSQAPIVEDFNISELYSSRTAIIVHHDYASTIYYIPDKNEFYIQHSKPILKYITYGPFQGDPREVLDFPPNVENEVDNRIATALNKDWGQPVDGLKCRLRIEKAEWKQEETPILFLDVKNEGTKTFEYLPSTGICCAISLDGKDYRRKGPLLWDGPPLFLKPGETITFKIELTSDWFKDENDNKNAILSIGKHTLKAKFITGIFGDVTAMSNPVEFEILPYEEVESIQNDMDNNTVVEAEEKIYQDLDESKQRLLKTFISGIDNEIQKIKNNYPQLTNWDKEQKQTGFLITGKEITKTSLIYNNAAFSGKSPGSNNWCDKNGCHIKLKLYSGAESPYMKTNFVPLSGSLAVLATVITANPENPELEQKITEIITSAAASIRQNSNIRNEDIQTEDNQKLSSDNLKQLGLAVFMYADDNNGKMPEKLDVLEPYFSDKQVFQWILKNVKYIGEGTINRSDTAKIPIAYDNTLQESNSTNFLFLDGHVAFEPIEKYPEFLIKKTQILIELEYLEVTEKFLEETNLNELLKDVSISVGGIWNRHILSFSRAILDDSQIESLFSQKSDNYKKLAAPKLLVFDNEAATINMEQEVSYVSGYPEPNKSSEISVPVIEHKNVGFTGTFTPHITPDNNDIVMEYELKNSFVAGYEERTFDDSRKVKVPLITQREMTSNILISRGKILVANLGETKSEENNSDSSQEKKVLLVLIKPTIVSPEQTKTQGNVINSNDTDMIGPPVGEFIINTSENTQRIKEQESTGISVSQPDPLQLLDENDKVIYNQLEQKVDLSHLNPSMTFEQVLEEFKKLTDPPLRIQPNWRNLSDTANITPTTPAEMEPLRDIKIRTALDILLISLSSKQFRISYTIHDGVILIATADSLPSNLVQRTYDISDLAILLPGINRNFNNSNDSNGIISGFKGEMGYDGISKYSIIKSIPELVNFIIQLIEPDSWYENNEKAQGTIYPYPASAPKKLAITNTPEVHFKIEKFLNALRESIDYTQVAVEAQVLHVSNAFLKQVGLDANSLKSSDVWTKYRVKEPDEKDSFVIDSLSADLLLKAIQERRGDHIIARLKVMVNDGKQASIEVKTEDVQLSKLDVEANPSIAESIRKRFGGLNAGTFINLTPQIVENNNVRLDAKLNVRDVVSPSTELKINGVIIQKGRTLKEKEDTSKEKLSVVTVFEKSLNALVPNSDSLLILGPEITRSTSREARHSLINLPILDRLFTIQGGYRIVDEYTILILIKPTIVLTEQNE